MWKHTDLNINFVPYLFNSFLQDEYPENISDESDPFTQLIFYASVEQGQNGEKEKKPTPTNISIALAEALISTEEIPIDAIKHELVSTFRIDILCSMNAG